MNGLDDIIDGIAKKAAEGQENRKSHLNEEYLLCCDICGEPIQCRIEVFDKVRTVYCMCRCEREEQQRRRDEIQQMMRDDRISRLKVNGFDNAEMQAWTFKNDDGKQPKVIEAAKKYCEKFEDFKADGKGLIFHGGVGTGKTFTAACIANELISNGIPVYMTNFANIVNALQSNYNGRQQYLEQLNKNDLLIIDDLAAERNTEYMNEIVYNVIDARYRLNLPLIVTTNISMQEMMNVTEISRQRIYSRVLEMCHPVAVTGTDRRKQAAMKNYAEMNKILGL